jgi:hypothetical protein
MAIEGGLVAAMPELHPQTSVDKDEKMKKFIDTLAEQISVPLCEGIMRMMTYVIAHISIEGKIVTVGSPSTQTAVLIPAPTPTACKKTPNMIGQSIIDDYTPKETSE